MGERLGGDGVRGRRRVQPGGALSGLRGTGDEAAVEDAAVEGAALDDGALDDGALETALAAAVRAADLGSRGEQQAVAAFLAARAEGAHRARTRRRDDWRPAADRRARRPAKLTFGVVFASLALGGVAVAAIGSAGSSTEGAGHGRGTTNPAVAAPNRPGDAASAPSSGSPRPTDRPATAQDTEAHCRAYAQVQGRGKALGATAWRRLVAAAGGADKVAAFCSEQLAAETAKPSHSTGAGKSGEGAANSANGGQGKGKNK
ncbi:hypothetical protein ACFWPQ_09315 [Streptomyces sp. NPDC058464]|uniref:hypothetical protein n=1 Tax=Streptomyces sp. NPDC058464 TaxID=3346511 RepID=UPI003665D3F8